MLRFSGPAVPARGAIVLVLVSQVALSYCVSSATKASRVILNHLRKVIE